MAKDAARALAPTVDDTYRQRSVRLEVQGESVYVPERLHFKRLDAHDRRLGGLSVAARCLITRATDGHLTQLALRTILAAPAPWVIPFVVLMAGDYVVEIVEEIRAALPTFDRDACSGFVRENRTAVRAIRARTVSYWNAYYRAAYPDQKDYPGSIVLTQLELWAS